MLIDIGEKIHVIERRLFDTDVRRHFFGEVERIDEGAVRATGYVFVFDSGSSAYVRGAGRRTLIVPISAPGYIIRVAPAETRVDDVRYEEDAQGRLVVTDGGAFTLDVNEFGRSR